VVERPVVVADPSLGVFETLLVRDGAVQALGAHLARLRGSTASLYALDPPDDLASRIRGQAAALGSGEHRLRIDIRPGEPGLDVTFQTGPLSSRPGLFGLRPLTLAGGYGAHKLADRGPLTGTSSASGGPVALLVDDDPEPTVLEAAWANVWLVDANRLITPPLDGRILPGITRARVIRLAGSLGLSVDQLPISLAQARAGQPMLTSSLQLAAPAAFEDRPKPDQEAVATIAEIRDALLQTDWE
jgi:para-aminobenzoate synthetase/4-amino-4-deoxychorismate lyase